MTVEELEAQVEEGLAKLRSPEYKSLESLLKPLTPSGYRAHVSLVDTKGGKARKKRRNASADNWTPESGEIRIHFEADTVAHGKEMPQGKSDSDLVRISGERVQAVVSDPVADLVRALDRAESRPGYQFVALKRFRDVDLPAEGFDWAKSDSTRQSVLRNSIDRHLILTSKVPNPKSPQFPVTAIRLNRLLPEIRTYLGKQYSDSEFNPISIRGEALSTTILRERR
jgi:hypothetical protein